FALECRGQPPGGRPDIRVSRKKSVTPTPAISWQTIVLILSVNLAAAAYPAWRAMKPHLAATMQEE
ncbi:MAG TPA: hypothetical protein VFC55_02535, partial [Desulfobaccales bacterium]|nr:hypothetical protein [Desulfobaccales bacterium]